MKNISLVVVEDQAMVRGALSALLTLHGGFEVIAEFSDGQAALRYLLDNTADLVLTDIEMPGLTGLELAAELSRRLAKPPKVVLLSTFSRTGYVHRARELGIAGYLLKEAPSDDLARSLKQVMRGAEVYDPSLVAESASSPDPLTDRERQVLRLAEAGQSTADIAGKVCRTEGTVRNILSETIRKLGVRNRAEALRLARDRGWL
ncbi:response regulator transcription factor [Reinekea blandensis]|uniref:DNA-binding response regulator, LuxR family protein n=1 Tax=Reinekea blandensis MED297 TaxID=314283 RepID=A4BKB2_9GAMM|nr:response regulator transcription factor [Reinekea blandensis]EAR07417.1 DNA-binding response regulator, LuxR family protein [Reinekea sp. MED297] [Reinekea blandensis MED297]